MQLGKKTGQLGNWATGTKEALPKHVHTVSTLTRPLSASTKALRSFFTQFHAPGDKSSRTHRVPNVVNLLRVLTVFCEIFMPDRVTDCKSLDTLDAAEGGSSHSHSPERQRGSLKLKQTMTVARRLKYFRNAAFGG